MAATDSRTPFVTKVQIEDANGDVALVSAGGALSVVSPTGTSSSTVQGAGADGAAVTGNPVLVAGTDGTNAQTLSVSATGAVNVQTAPPVAVAVGHLAHTATTAAANFLTVAAGETWRGCVTIVCDVGVAAASATAGQALGVVTTAGTGVTPAAATMLSCEARAGANAATGTGGSQGANSVTINDFVLIAPVGNSVTLQGATTIAGTDGRVSYSANGVYL